MSFEAGAGLKPAPYTHAERKEREAMVAQQFRWARGTVLVLAMIGVLVLTATFTACSSTSGSTAPAKPATPAAAQDSKAAAQNSKPSGESAAKPAPAKLTPVKIAVLGATISDLPLRMAVQGGFMKENGLDVTLVNTRGGSEVIQALVSGDVQAGHVGLSPAMLAGASGANQVMVVSSSNRPPFMIFGSQSIKNLKQLEGGKVGISRVGSESDILTRMALENAGLNTSKITFLQIGGNPERFAAVETKQVDAAPLESPETIQANKAGFHMLLDMVTGAEIPWDFNGLVVNRKYADEHPDIIYAMVKAYMQGGYYAKSHPEEAKKVFATFFKVEDKAALDDAYKTYMALFVTDGRPSVKGAENQIKQLSAQRKELSDMKPERFVDTRFLDRLEKEGFFKSVDK